MWWFDSWIKALCFCFVFFVCELRIHSSYLPVYCQGGMFGLGDSSFTHLCRGIYHPSLITHQWLNSYSMHTYTYMQIYCMYIVYFTEACLQKKTAHHSLCTFLHTLPRTQNCCHCLDNHRSRSSHRSLCQCWSRISPVKPCRAPRPSSGHRYDGKYSCGAVHHLQPGRKSDTCF